MRGVTADNKDKARCTFDIEHQVFIQRKNSLQLLLQGTTHLQTKEMKSLGTTVSSVLANVLIFEPSYKHSFPPTA